jgi:quercetin dioxygenase-like cupin family protein
MASSTVTTSSSTSASTSFFSFSSYLIFFVFFSFFLLSCSISSLVHGLSEPLPTHPHGDSSFKIVSYMNEHHHEDPSSQWKHNGVRIVHANELDINTAQTVGMNRAAAITTARTGAENLWAGTVTIHPEAKTGAHHHGPIESVIYIVKGKAKMRWVGLFPSSPLLCSTLHHSHSPSLLTDLSHLFHVEGRET